MSGIVKVCRKCGIEGEHRLNNAHSDKADQACKVCRRQHDREMHAKLRNEVLDTYGPICVGCGEKDRVVLSIDHVGGGGNEHRREIGSRIYVWLKRNRYPREGFRILCLNCQHRARMGVLSVDSE